MKFKSLFIIGCMSLLGISAANAQTDSQNADSIKREDALRKDRAARADVYVVDKNILTHEPTKVDVASTTKKTAVKQKRKGCRKNKQ